MFFFFFFKQKTAYEISSRDWSSDVCSSDLPAPTPTPPPPAPAPIVAAPPPAAEESEEVGEEPSAEEPKIAPRGEKGGGKRHAARAGRRGMSLADRRRLLAQGWKLYQ